MARKKNKIFKKTFDLFEEVKYFTGKEIEEIKQICFEIGFCLGVFHAIIIIYINL